jgi:hypothetical protein
MTGPPSNTGLQFWCFPFSRFLSHCQSPGLISEAPMLGETLPLSTNWVDSPVIFWECLQNTDMPQRHIIDYQLAGRTLLPFTCLSYQVGPLWGLRTPFSTKIGQEPSKTPEEQSAVMSPPNPSDTGSHEIIKPKQLIFYCNTI